MSYDLAVWVGDPPESDQAAAERYAALVPLLEQPAPEPPHPALLAFADELLARYPDIDEEAGEDSPWSEGPLKNDIVGSFFYFPMRYGSVQEAVPLIVEHAAAHHLVCFDPQTERLLTPAAKRHRNPFKRRSDFGNERPHREE